MHERIKERDRGIQLARTQTSAVSKHANKLGYYPLWGEVKFIDRDPHWYTRRVKEAIHIRLHPKISISEEWIPQRTCEGTASSLKNEYQNPSNVDNNSKDRNSPITNSHGAAYNETQPIDIIA